MPRPVRVVTIAQLNRGGPTFDDNLRRIGQFLELAGAERPDIICLPEAFTLVGVAGEHLGEVAETVPGPIVDYVADHARRHHCYIICPLFVRHSDRITNDAVLIDRQGQVVGAYSKLHPVADISAFNRLEIGVTPGSDVPVFDTDFGRIGMQICFDLNFDDGWSELKRKGAEIVFWSSQYNGGRLLTTRVWQYHYYLVSAVSTYYSRIMNVLGDVLATTGQFDTVAVHTIDLDVGLYHLDYNRVVLPQIHLKYGPDVVVCVGHEEDIFTLESRREGLTVNAIAEEFLLDPLDDYLARNIRLQDAVREGRPLPDLTPRYAGRPRTP